MPSGFNTRFISLKATAGIHNMFKTSCVIIKSKCFPQVIFSRFSHLVPTTALVYPREKLGENIVRTISDKYEEEDLPPRDVTREFLILHSG